MGNNCICHEGIIKAIDGQKLTVSMTVSSACAACHAKSMCGNSDKSERIIQTINYDLETFEIGEQVRVEMKEELATQAILIGYLFPFLILVTTFIILSFCIQNELISVLSSLMAVAVYYLIIWKFKKKIDQKFVFKVTKLYNI